MCVQDHTYTPEVSPLKYFQNQNKLEVNLN